MFFEKQKHTDKGRKSSLPSQIENFYNSHQNYLEVNWKKVDILANIDEDYNEAKYLEVEIVIKNFKDLNDIK